MARIETKLAADTMAANRAAMLAQWDAAEAIAARAAAASERSRDRFAARGQLLPRDRVALLLDPGAPFLELARHAGYGMDTDDRDRSVPGGGVIGGIGQVSGHRCVICASDSGIAAGALQPMGLDKQLRLQDIALQNALPYVQLVESAGANLLDYRVEDFVQGGRLFANLARLSAAGLPVVTVTHGSSTAGGAYQTGLSDHIVMVRGRTRAFLAGPPLLKAATGEIASEEELGGAEMHTAISGLGDHLAEDDRHAIAIARGILAGIDPLAVPEAPRAFDPPAYPAEDLAAIMPADLRQPVDMREVIARLVDGSDFIETGARHGAGTVCGMARIEGWPVGIVTNNGPIDTAGAGKAAHFIQSCCQKRAPILYLVNTTGFMVGRAYEEAGIIARGSAMIKAVANADVPQITLNCGASYGAGNYGMNGRGFGPRFAFSWPNARTAVMGAAQAAETMAIVQRARATRQGKPVDEAQLAALTGRITANFEAQMSAVHTSARLLDDGVIDPRDSRAILAEVLAICRASARAAPGPVQFGVPRP